MFNINDDPVMNRMVRNDITGIREDGIILGKGCQNVRIEVQTVNPCGKKSYDRENNGNYQEPSQDIFLHIRIENLKNRSRPR
jgi:hypothetical protein